MRLITGGAGFIGSHLAEALVARGERVRVVDDLSAGDRSVLDPLVQQKRIEFVRGDILKPDVASRALKEVEEVWHLAADPDARRGATQPGAQFRLGPELTYGLLDGMRKADVRRIHFSSSSVVYGEPSVYPTPETYGPCIPISTYGAAKVAAEGFIAGFAGTYGLRAWIYRFGNVVGPRMSHGVIYDFAQKLKKDPTRLEILGDGHQEKSYLSMHDCLAGMLHGRDHAQAAVNVLNLASESATTVRRIAELLIVSMGLKKVRFEFTGGERGWPGDVRKMRLSIDAMRALGWRPRHSSEDAVRLACEWISGAHGAKIK